MSGGPRLQLGSTLRRVVGSALGLVVWAWVRTLSVVKESPEMRGTPRRVLSFFHGQQMALLAAPRAPTAVLVSQSKDGDIQSGVLGRLGFEVTRGSSSRGGARGLLGLLGLVRSGFDAAFAVDGPRGPRGQPKPGAALTAELTGAVLVPVGSAARRKIVLRRAWDAFEIPLPFSRVAIVLGAPISAEGALRSPEILRDAIVAARARAEQLVALRTPEEPCPVASR